MDAKKHEQQRRVRRHQLEPRTWRAYRAHRMPLLDSILDHENLTPRFTAAGAYYTVVPLEPKRAESGGH